MKRILLLVGTEKGAFVLSSNEAREHWEIRGPLHKGWKVNDLQLDMRGEPPVLWAAVGHFVYGPSVQRSFDLGKTWEPIKHGPKYGADANWKLNDIWSIVPGRADEPEVLYAGVADAGIFVSRDGGDHWEEMTGLTKHESRSEWSPGGGGLCCHTILLHPNDKNRMWIGISSVGVFQSDDGGENWTTKNTGLTKTVEEETQKDVGYCVHRLVLDPTNPDRLFQQNHRGVYRSVDGAGSWERIEVGLPLNATKSCFGFPIVISPHDPDTLFVIPQESDEYRFAPDGQLAVYRTIDAGDTWRRLANGLPGDHFTGVLRQAMAIDDWDENGVYFGTTAGQIFFSRNDGENWQAMPCQLPRIASVSAVTLKS